MTTELQRRSPCRGTGALLGAAVAVSVVGVVLMVAAAVAQGAPAAYGALVGVLLVLGVLGLGSAVVDVVARVMPTASLMVALMTYGLQVVLMAALFAGLTRSGLLEDALDRQWLGGAVIAGTLTWMVAQLVLSTQARIPAYDLPSEPASQAPVQQPEAGAR